MDKFITPNYAQNGEDISFLTNGSEISIYGMIHSLRVTKWGGFIVLRKPKGLLQIVVQNDSSQILNENNEKISISDLSREMAVKITGQVQQANIKDPAALNNSIEISLSVLNVLSTPSTKEVIDLNALKFNDEDSILRYKLDNRQITLRNPKDISIFKVSSVIVKAFSEYLSDQNFTQIFTPKIVAEGAEGGANVFSLDYFGKHTYLAQSPQFYKQMCVGVFERVFEIAPAYRAEKHNTSRHLNEYISLDVEMGFISSQNDVMQLEIGLLKHIIEQVSIHCVHELNILNADLPTLPERVPVYRLTEVHDILYSNNLTVDDHRGEPDLAPEEEKAICKYVKEQYNSDFVFVTHFPSSHRAFYAMDDPNDPSLTLSFDLLMRGMEITSGGQRIHKEDDYKEKMIKKGMNPENFQFYLDTFKNGMPPHGGFAIGLERITACFLGLSNVKEASLFPRDINRVTP